MSYVRRDTPQHPGWPGRQVGSTRGKKPAVRSAGARTPRQIIDFAPADVERLQATNALGGFLGGDFLMTEPDWLLLNRANWDERVAAHLAPESDYDLSGLRLGNYALHGIEERELGPVTGFRLVHL